MKPENAATTILVAGGCHVVGYPIGEGNSFVRVAKDTLKNGGIEAEFSCLSYLSIKHTNRLVKAFESNVPDVVVLQLGNFETTVTYRAFLRRILGLKAERASQATKTLPATTVFAQTATWKVKCALKLFGDTVLLHSLVDMEAVRENLGNMLDAVSAAGVPETLLLSPLPCADPLYMRYRRDLSNIMAAEARRRGLVYVDLINSFDLNPRYYVDGTHLNAAGQHWIGKIVAETLASLKTVEPGYAGALE